MKDSFILYTEQKAVIDKLTDEQAGKIIKAIYEYVETDKMPQLDNILDLVITPFKLALDRNKAKYEKVSKIRAEAGAKGGKQKKQMQTKESKCNDNENVNENDNENVNINEQEEKIHFAEAEYVTMTNAEYEKLVSTYGKDFANQCITVLDNYKGSKNKKYKSDYRAILSWVVDKVKEKGIKPNKKKEEDFIAVDTSQLTQEEYGKLMRKEITMQELIEKGKVNVG